ncbi:YSC84-related protein [Marinicella sediminis]|uniref:YSC84-related protein n=1 Tax=Marinicella sediminis TaxID=1792834 RepID=A0ABV7JEG1_9GAMM|nr:YSC84-related protein [Marinicella sediminis]
MKNTIFCLLLALPLAGLAKSAQEINILADATLERFAEEITGGQRFLNEAAAVLVFPQVLKAGFGIGGEYGEGVLRQGGQNVAYYSTAAASIGFQAGAQSKAVVVVFMNQQALTDFRGKKGWKAGVDGSVAVIKWGVGEDINTLDIKDPVVGFVFSNKGLMFNLTLEGSKFTEISR